MSVVLTAAPAAFNNIFSFAELEEFKVEFTSLGKTAIVFDTASSDPTDHDYDTEQHWVSDAEGQVLFCISACMC